MAFTVREYYDLLTLLENHPEWKAELRKVLLGEDFLQLPFMLRDLRQRFEKRMDELQEAYLRHDREIAEIRGILKELAEAQKRTEKRLEELAEAQKRTEKSLEELTKAQRVTEERLW